MTLKTRSLLTLGWISVAVGACGQDPSFVDLERKNSNVDVTQGSRSADASTDDDNIDNFGEGGGVLGNVIGSGPSDPTATNPTAKPGTSTGTNDSTTPVDPTHQEIPNIPGNETDAVRRCLAKWGSDNPFPQTITNVKRIVAVSVGGIGTAVDDRTPTTEPQLVIIAAGVNVGGSPVYNLLNPNGYYCMVANINVNTNLSINLHCNARLADSLVDVGVGSTMADNTSRVGVHVNSTVTVNTSRPSGDECVR